MIEIVVSCNGAKCTSKEDFWFDHFFNSSDIVHEVHRRGWIRVSQQKHLCRYCVQNAMKEKD